MTKHYWLATLAVIMVTLMSSTYAQSMGEAPGRQETGSKHNEPKANVPLEIGPAIQKDIHSIATALDAANRKQPSKAEETRADRNLDAQEKMAAAVPYMFGVGFSEMLITLGGVFLVWRTLKATWAAKNEAQRAADAAEKSLQQTDAHGRQAMRAYVSAFRRTSQRRGATVICELFFKNFGTTPAYKAAWDSEIWVDGIVPTVPEIDLKNASTITIVPDGEFSNTLRLTISDDDWAEIGAGKKYIWCTGLLEYLDTFGERRFLSYRFFAANDCLVEAKEEKMYISDAGNDSN